MTTGGNGVVCLQGGNEITPRCRPMDEALLALAPGGPVVVLPLASEPGSDYSRTAQNAMRYFSELGSEVFVPPDPRQDAADAEQALRSAGMIVLTGGWPRPLPDALLATGLGEDRRGRPHPGGRIMGASARGVG